MDFKQLEAFVRVCDLKSFSKAAEDIFLSQPSISAYISSLEKELDVRLINRSTKDVSPTVAGKTFYGHAKSMLALRNKSVLSLKKLTDCTVGDIDIMASSVPAQYMLPDILAEFHKLYPNILFRVNQADTAEVIKGISEQRGEVGFCGAKTENPKCVFEYLTSDKLIIIAPYKNKPAYKSVTDLLYNEYFIMRESGSGTRMIYEEFFKNAGIKPDKLKVSACFNNTESIINAVSSGLGFSVVSELAAKNFISQNKITSVSPDFPFPERAFYLVLKKNCAITPVTDVFIKFVRSIVKKN